MLGRADAVDEVDAGASCLSFSRWRASGFFGFMGAIAFCWARAASDDEVSEVARVSVGLVDSVASGVARSTGDGAGDGELDGRKGAAEKANPAGATRRGNGGAGDDRGDSTSGGGALR